MLPINKYLVVIFSLFYVLTIFLGNKPVYAAQSNCATIKKVELSTQSVTAKTPFQCIVTVDDASAGSPNIACGVSFNDEWPENFCPSDIAFGGWQGNKAIFNCIINNTHFDSSIMSIKLKAFDFQQSCGVDTGLGIPLPVTTNANLPVVNPHNNDQAVVDIFKGLLSNVTFSRPTLSGSPAPTQSTTVTSSPIRSPTQTTQLSQTPTGLYASLFASQAQVQWIRKPQEEALISGRCQKNKQVYQQAESATGIPWEVLAGIHYRENNCDPSTSLVSGRPFGTNEVDLGGNCSTQNVGPGKPYPIAGGGCAFHTLLDTAIYAGNLLKMKINGLPHAFPDVVLALSRYNGTGNQNCGQTPYKSCPPQFRSEDDSYVMSGFDERHNPMYVVYCSNGTKCIPPPVDTRFGTATVANIIDRL